MSGVVDTPKPQVCTPMGKLFTLIPPRSTMMIPVPPHPLATPQQALTCTKRALFAILKKKFEQERKNQPDRMVLSGRESAMWDAFS